MASGGYRLGAGRKPARKEMVHNMVAFRMFSVIKEYLDSIDKKRDANGELPYEDLKAAAHYVQPFALRAMPQKLEIEGSEDNLQDIITLAKTITAISA